MSKTHTIITIGRQFGSGGREIGKRLADELEIEFYDKELLSRAAKDSKICKELFETHDEKPTNSFLYSLVMDTYSMGFASGSVNEMPLNHKIFLAQFDAIKKIAETRTVPDTTADVTWTKPSTVMPVSEKNLELFRHVQKAADMIGYGKLTRAEQTAELDCFVPMINSWGICDSSCATCHFMKKDQEYWYGYLQKWLKSSREYEIRFGVVCLLDFFINEAYIDAVLEEMKKIHHDGYYVKMAVAWAVSICYIHFPEKTQKLLKENSLDDWTHNKTIQKIRESLRISKEEKEMLKTWKR